MRRNKVQAVAVPAIDIPERGLADADRILQHGRKHRLKIAGGAVITLEHFRRSRLLLQRFREVGCAFGEVRGALPQFVEQPRVLDGDDGLGGEVLHQRNLFVGEGSNFLAVHTESADQFVLLQHWHHQNRPYAPKFDTCDDPRIAISVGFLRAQISDVNHFLFAIMRPVGVFGLGRNGERLRASAKAVGALCVATKCRASPSQR